MRKDVNMKTTIKLSNGCEIPNFCYGTAIVLSYKYAKKIGGGAKCKYLIRNLLKDRGQLKKMFAFPTLYIQQ